MKENEKRERDKKRKKDNKARAERSIDGKAAPKSRARYLTEPSIKNTTGQNSKVL